MRHQNQNQCTLPVSEVFYSIQGEGWITSGMPAVFLRLSSCNLLCGGKDTIKTGKPSNGALWRCDTIEVWLKKTNTPFEKVFNEEQLHALKNQANLVITGGEPLLHQNKIIEFIKWLNEQDTYPRYIEIETNATIAPSTELVELGVLFNISPKLSSSGVPFSKAFRRHVLERFIEIPFFRGGSIFKFVISSYRDWEEIEEHYLPLFTDFRTMYDDTDPAPIILMPAGSTREELIKNSQLVADIVKKNPNIVLGMCTRLQVEIWDQTTGV